MVDGVARLTCGSVDGFVARSEIELGAPGNGPLRDVPDVPGVEQRAQVALLGRFGPCDLVADHVVVDGAAMSPNTPNGAGRSGVGARRASSV